MHGRVAKDVDYSYQDIERELRDRNQRRQAVVLYCVAVAAFVAPLIFQIGIRAHWW